MASLLARGRALLDNALQPTGQPSAGPLEAQWELLAMADDSRSRTLVALGASLFLLGLLTGVLVPAIRSPRIGLSAHLEGVMNGTFLMVVGAIWHHVRLSPSLSRLCFWLLVYGTFTNWLFVLLGGVFGAGRMMPIAGGGITGQPWQELVVGAGLVSLSVAMVVGCGLLAWGLFRRA